MLPFRRIPAIFLNGLSVALGVGCIELAFGLLGGSQAAQLALSGAVCTSLADVPGTVSRTWHRVPAAAVLGFIAAFAVHLLRPHPVALGLAIALIAFVAMMTMAWGARAGAVSFAPILSLVFAMSMPAGSEPLPVLAGWNAAGAAAYLAWSLVAGVALQRRYRALALADAVGAAATLLRARIGLLIPAASDAEHARAMRAWVLGEADLAERLQTARDFVFPQRDAEAANRETAILLRMIDLRDLLLASRLDLHRVGDDAVGRWILAQLGGALRQIATTLDTAAAALRDGVAPAPLPEPTPAPAFDGLLRPAPRSGGDARVRLFPAMEHRLASLAADATQIHALLRGQSEAATLTRAQLQRFVAPEGWPWRALHSQLNWSSPVLRHALRSALATGSAYAIALVLPWASHPHWLVLSVAVVLRGSLDQTLSRRNARVLGTLFGCAVVLGLAGTRSGLLLGAVFLASVGVAHSYVMHRYWLTATAATVMALLQSHMADPAAGFAVGERVADTLLGALLAWGFSYVLPSWERRSLPAAIARVLEQVGAYAGHALQLQTQATVEQRLARSRAYDALGAVAAALQRSTAEPASVRPYVPAVADLLDHGQQLMAQLSVLRLMLAQRHAELPSAPTASALAAARAALAAHLRGTTAPGTAVADAVDPGGLEQESPAADALGSLQRRLGALIEDAREMRRAATAALRRADGANAR